MENTINKIWVQIEDKIKNDNYTHGRIYRRFDNEKDNGIRLAVSAPGNIRELLIELEPSDKTKLNAPQWAGMGFQIITLDIHQKETKHVRFYFENPEHESVFTMVCADIVVTLLEVVRPEHRSVQLQTCLEKWSRFFQKHGTEGLSREAQRGLLGELFWLQKMISAGINMLLAIQSWQGCRRSYHDFEYSNGVVEVKTTTSKEPRKIRINNERQLDNRGIEKMLLYVLTLHPSLSGGLTLPGIINDLRKVLINDVSSRDFFEFSLREAGYLDIHEKLYTEKYIAREEEIFHVRKGFPRITDMPSGVGDISYSVTIAACTDFLVDSESVMDFIKKGDGDG